MTDRSATATPVLPSPRGTVLPGEGADWTPPSWDDVVREHADRVYRLAYRLTGNPHDAEDLTQETFIRVFRSLADYKPGTFEGWLHRITTNLFLDMVRRRARLRMEGLPEDSRPPTRRRARARAGLLRHPPRPASCRPRWTSWRPSSGPRSCSATSRGCRTRRSVPRWG